MDFKQQIIDELTERFAVSANDATDRQFYEAAVGITRGILQKKRAQSAKREKEQGAKKVYYMSMEFLIGRSLKNNLYNLGLETQMRDALRELGGDLDKLYEMEPDAGLGNGGLGRLASCYLDSLTGLNYPATGFSIRYEFGIFKQVIMDGWQVEYPDNWLELGGAWLVPRPDESEEVYFDGYVEENWSDSGLKTVHKDYTRVLAVPYDILISGNGDIVNKLRIIYSEVYLLPNGIQNCFFQSVLPYGMNRTGFLGQVTICFTYIIDYTAGNFAAHSSSTVSAA